jgi:hypothetical protein
MMKQKISSLGLAFSAIIALLLLSFSVSAIPETDLEKFRASGRFFVKFDGYTNDTQYQTVSAFHNESLSFYVIFRANAGDAPPYDDFHVEYKCLGDALPTEFHTRDYPSWNASGLISFRKNYAYNGITAYYDNSTISSSWSYCWIISANGLDAVGNAGYSEFYVELVPVLNTLVITLDSFCSDEARVNLIEQLTSGIYLVLEKNVNFLYTLWIVFQILAVLFIVLGIPILIFLIVRWAIWRISGFKILDRRSSYD